MNKTLKFLFLANSLTVFASTLIAPLYALFLQNNFSKTNAIYSAGTAFFITTLGTLISSFILRHSGDKFNHKTLLQIGYLGKTALWFIYPILPTIYFVYIIQFFLGFFEAIGSTGYDTLVAENLDQKQHIKNYSSWRLLSHTCMLASSLIGASIASSFGFLPLFFIMSAFSFVSFFIVTNIKFDN